MNKKLPLTTSDEGFSSIIDLVPIKKFLLKYLFRNFIFEGENETVSAYLLPFFPIVIEFSMFYSH